MKEIKLHIESIRRVQVIQIGCRMIHNSASHEARKPHARAEKHKAAVRPSTPACGRGAVKEAILLWQRRPGLLNSSSSSLVHLHCLLFHLVCVAASPRQALVLSAAPTD